MKSYKWSLRVGVALAALVLAPMAAQANNGNPDYLEYDGGMTLEGPVGGGGGLPSIVLSHAFDGISQNTVRSLHQGYSFIPPDTNGAAGVSQYMETSNGAYAVYDKATGAQTKLWADGNFWAQAGQANMNGDLNFANGDSRVLFDTRSNRWIVSSFGANLDTIAIAVSDTSDATGGWKSTTFTGYAGGIADYPTLAIDSKAVYIGTNNFTASGDFTGTTLNVIARDDLFGSGAPNVMSLKQFTTDYPGPANPDRGFSIQGVNQLGDDDAGQVLATGIAHYGFTHYDVLNPGTAGATLSGATLVSPLSNYDPNDLGSQPNGSRVIDTLDDRISSSVYELNGKIYALHTITPTNGSHTEVEWQVVDAATGALIQKGVIGDATHDYFQGSISVNAQGKVVIGYNRSGFGADGNIAIMAQGFTIGPDGKMTAQGAEQMLHQSTVGNFNQSRWGDYSQVSYDPTDANKFWVIGQYAVSANTWGTWISAVDMDGGAGAVPEPSSWMLMLAGFGVAGVAARRRRRAAA